MENQAYAGFWIRVAASLIDTVIMMLVFGLLITVLSGGDFTDMESAPPSMMMILLQYIAPVAITVWFWVKYLGTPGKMLLKLQVVDATTGEALSTPQAIGRYLGYYVSILPLMLGIIWVAFDARKQGFHDKLAGTVVIHTPPP